MEPETYFVVRVTTRFLDDTLPEEMRTKMKFVSNDAYFGRGNAKTLRDFDQAARYKSVSETKKALRYACVRDALDRTHASDPKRRRATFSPHLYKKIRVETTAEVVKVRVVREYEVVDVTPKRHPLEHLATQAG